MEEGETERRARGFYSPTYLEQRRPMEACPRWAAEVAGDGGGGGAVGVGGGLEVAGELVVLEGCVRAYL